MKKRVRSQPTNPYYTDEPAVSKSLIADKAMVPNPNLGNTTPKVVDKKPGRLSGLTGFVSKAKPHAGKSHFTPTVSPPQGKLRMSGHSSAHRIGSKFK